MKLSVALLMLIFVLNAPGFAHQLSQCGFYEADGYLTENESAVDKSKTVMFYIDRGSESETKVKLETMEFKKLKHFSGMNLNYSLVLDFKMNCRYECEARVVKIIKHISEDDKMKVFAYPRPKPLKGTAVITKDVDCK